MSISTQSVPTSYILSDDDRRSFDADGYVKLRGVIDPEVLRGFGPAITDKVIELNTQHLPLEERDTYGKAFLQVSNLWREDAIVEGFVRSPDLARLAAELLGVDGVRIYHDQALYKEAGGGITPWHADQYYWPMSSDRCVTIWIPLQDTPADMGPLTFAVGSHRFEVGRDLPISDESEERLQQLLTEQEFDVDDQAYALGDVSFHLGWTFHRAGPNTSAEPRRVMTIIYMDAEMRLEEPTNENRKVDLATWTPGMRPGDVAASELNPVVYPSTGSGS